MAAPVNQTNFAMGGQIKRYPSPHRGVPGPDIFTLDIETPNRPKT